MRNVFELTESDLADIKVSLEGMGECLIELKRDDVEISREEVIELAKQTIDITKILYDVIEQVVHMDDS